MASSPLTTPPAASSGSVSARNGRNSSRRIAAPFPTAPRREEVGKRALKNLALSYLSATGDREWLDFAATQFRDTDNMTDRMAALGLLARDGGESGRDRAGGVLRPLPP